MGRRPGPTGGLPAAYVLAGSALVHESAHRAAWADLRSAVCGAGRQPAAASCPAGQLARDLALAEAAFERT